MKLYNLDSFLVYSEKIISTRMPNVYLHYIDIRFAAEVKFAVCFMEKQIFFDKNMMPDVASDNG